MSLSRKEQAIIDAVRAAIERRPSTSNAPGGEAYDIAIDVADALEEEEGFERDRFLEACGLSPNVAWYRGGAGH